MECAKCKENIEEGEERELHGRVLCEDCYMDALSPPRGCDPWAVYTSKSFSKQEGMAPGLNETQEKILRLLEESGGAPPEEIAERLQIKPSDLQRELAALRHMEKIRGKLANGKRIVIPW